MATTGGPDNEFQFLNFILTAVSAGIGLMVGAVMRGWNAGRREGASEAATTGKFAEMKNKIGDLDRRLEDHREEDLRGFGEMRAALRSFQDRADHMATKEDLDRAANLILTAVRGVPLAGQ